MKQLPILTLLALFAIISCKKKETPAPSPSPAVLNGLTGIKYKTQYYSAGQPTPTKYYTWTFSGTNPITAITGADSTYAGYQKMFLTANNVTRLEYYTSDPVNVMRSTTVTVTYNASNLPDTMSVQYRPGLGRKKFAFEYTGSQLTKITEARQQSLLYDTLNWAIPYCYYFYSYNGTNLSQLVIKKWYYSSPPPVSYYTFDTLHYTTGTIKNNLAGSFSLYCLLEFIASTNYQSSFPDALPFYLSANAIESVSPNSSSFSYKYITDPKGRITHRLMPGFSSYDTTFYYY